MTETHEQWYRRHMVEVVAPQLVNVAPQMARDFWMGYFDWLKKEAEPKPRP
jgi:hypothetical protein